MNKKYLVVLLIVAAALVACVGIAMFACVKTNALRHAYNELVLDNKDHFLSCDELPPVAEVERVVQEHQDVIEKIEQVNPGQIFVDVDTTTCPGKADLVISYPTHQNRLEIERIIGGDRFFGVPYRLRNI